MIKCIVAYLIALFAPVIYFATTLQNEKHPLLPFVVCPVILAIAGFVSGYIPKGDNKDVWKWVLWSAIVGVVMAILFTVSK